MSIEFYEIHQREYEAMLAYFQEQEDLALMDADYVASGGHLWD